jgi:acetyl-CoA carboxylase biotin carboxyl carrier protein
MSAGSNIKPQDVEGLIELFKSSNWDEMHVQVGEFELFLSNDPKATGPGRAVAAPAIAAPALAAAAPVASAAPAAIAPAAHGGAATVAIPDGLIAICAPNLGTFYRAPKPGAPPYVEVGQTISEDTEVCLIEVMKLFAPVAAGVRGVVREVLAKDGQMVEFDAPLMLIEPAK